MRVLHLIPTLGGGGAERQVAYLAEGLRALGCDVHLGASLGGVNLARAEATGATVHSLASHGQYDPRILWRTVRLISRLRPHIVQTWLTQMDVVGGVAARLTGSTWIVSERADGEHYPSDVKHWLRRVTGKYADAVIANSPVGLSFWNGSRGRQFVVPNAAPLEELAAVPPDDADFRHAKVILFVGRLTDQKNPENLVAALAKVVKQRDAVALLCGCGPSEGMVRAAIEAAGCSERIHLLGFTDRVIGLMKRADVLVAPSWFEGNPNAVIEAAACGCPLVLSAIPSHAFVPPDGALFAPPGDPDAIAEAVLRTLDDPDAARQRAEVARSVAMSRSIATISAAYLQIYEEMLRGSRRTRESDVAISGV
jgi:glycosyltransferase involved in cell wall biosynthesis